jgi:hypothetical protein
MFIIEYKRTGDGIYSKFEDIKERTIPSSLVTSSSKNAFYVGELFDSTKEKLFESGWEKSPNILSKFCSALYLVKHEMDECHFATDISGRELLFYYYDESKFILSDSMWGIINIVKPGIDDIDKEVIEEMIAIGGSMPCDYKTIIKNMFWVGANYIGHFNPKNWTLEIERYAVIRRTGTIKDISQAVENMDMAMSSMAKKIVERHRGEKIGLGLSGGLDSRIALHYLKKANANLVCFNTSDSKPNGWLLASNLINSHKLAEKAGVDYYDVEWFPSSIRYKMDVMLKNQPIGTCGHYTNAYKYESFGMPKFDVLVGAGQAIGPMLVGVSVAENSKELTQDNVKEYLMHLATSEVRGYSYRKYIVRKQLNQLGMKFIDFEKGKDYSFWNSIIGEATYQRIRNKVNKYVDLCYELNYSPADVTLDYRTSALGPTGRNGAYESQLGTKKSYTIYTPFLIKEALKWDETIVENRKILKELISKKYQNLHLLVRKRMVAQNKSNQPFHCSGKSSFIYAEDQELWQMNGMRITHTYIRLLLRI